MPENQDRNEDERHEPERESGTAIGKIVGTIFHPAISVYNATRNIPYVRQASAILGLAAISALAIAITGNVLVAVFGPLFLVLLNAVLSGLSKAAKDLDKRGAKGASSIMMGNLVVYWVTIALVLMSFGVVFTSFAFKWPQPIRALLLIDIAPVGPAKIERQDNPSSGSIPGSFVYAGPYFARASGSSAMLGGELADEGWFQWLLFSGTAVSRPDLESQAPKKAYVIFKSAPFDANFNPFDLKLTANSNVGETREVYAFLTRVHGELQRSLHIPIVCERFRDRDTDDFVDRIKLPPVNQGDHLFVLVQVSPRDEELPEDARALYTLLTD